MSWLKELKVGDQVFVVYSSRHKQPQYVAVTKVGRKWIELANYTGRADRTQDTSRGVAVMEFEYGSPNTIYPDRKAFEEREKVFRLRKRIEAGIRDYTPEQLLRFAEIIGLDDDEEADESQS